MTAIDPDSNLLTVDQLCLHFPQGKRLWGEPPVLRAVDGVSFKLDRGETLGLVGESGCGKSSLGKALLNLHRPTSGSVHYQGRDIAGLPEKQMRPLRRDLQMIFQDPFESLNSRHTVGAIVEEPLIIHRQGDRKSRQQRVMALLDRVGLPASAADKYPHEFSGGQRQRIGIARAIALTPKVLICDEAVSALDVSVQAQILNLLLEIQQELELSMLFISHDLSVVRHMSDRIAVMYLGKLVEVGDAEAIYQAPRHPYTQSLLAAIPSIGKTRVSHPVIAGDLPSPLIEQPGCGFYSRCPYRQADCKSQRPTLTPSGTPQQPARGQHHAACHYWQDISAGKLTPQN
ncbi:ATP-binding cassette domain-containing protein [Spongiibacter nanhainus]|uniref:ATP-binding cassette domain-containing protein n=1 Tax=Spongiibacter nanhainus TaxID=2794344 RepID=A0A7T4R3Q4_9GAMM|nr:oligopeptide/dipeptide ABC transporter ATP-binding protein [Spongiibacter nanhainus]QQD19916.1 ATP-binding cassette domain-containing protein [Spongiibacter nanhainus]